MDGFKVVFPTDLDAFCPPVYMFMQAFQLCLFLRCKAMSYPEKQAREAWASTGEEKEEEEEEGNEEEKEPAIVDRV